MEISLLGPCNIYCGSCALYKKCKCLGCAEESRRAEKAGKVFCDVYLCARNKNLATCSDRLDYPCEKYDRGIFTEGFIKWIRDKLKENEKA